MARTTVVTVTYNSAQTIGPLLEALRSAQRSGLVEIVVVDNASRDDTLAALEPFEREGLVRLVHAGGNIGFGRGCNLGAAHAATEFVLFLNPDARLEPEAIRALESTLDHHTLADVVAPAIEQEDHTLQPVGVLPTRLGMIFERSPLHRLFIRPRRPQPGEPPHATNWVSGAAFMVRREAFTALGGFDPRFFLYYEESDLFRRFLRAGRQILITGQAVCHHIGGHSAQTVQSGRIAGSIAEHYISSRNHYARKHFGMPVMWLADLSFFTTLLVRGLISRRPADRATWRARRGVGLFVTPTSAVAPGAALPTGRTATRVEPPASTPPRPAAQPAERDAA